MEIGNDTTDLRVSMENEVQLLPDIWKIIWKMEFLLNFSAYLYRYGSTTFGKWDLKTIIFDGHYPLYKTFFLKLQLWQIGSRTTNYIGHFSNSIWGSVPSWQIREFCIDFNKDLKKILYPDHMKYE